MRFLILIYSGATQQEMLSARIVGTEFTKNNLELTFFFYNFYPLICFNLINNVSSFAI